MHKESVNFAGVGKLLGGAARGAGRVVGNLAGRTMIGAGAGAIGAGEGSRLEGALMGGMVGAASPAFARIGRGIGNKVAPGMMGQAGKFIRDKGVRHTVHNIALPAVMAHTGGSAISNPYQKYSCDQTMSKMAVSPSTLLGHGMLAAGRVATAHPAAAGRALAGAGVGALAGGEGVDNRLGGAIVGGLTGVALPSILRKAHGLGARMAKLPYTGSAQAGGALRRGARSAGANPLAAIAALGAGGSAAVGAANNLSYDHPLLVGGGAGAGAAALLGARNPKLLIPAALLGAGVTALGAGIGRVTGLHKSNSAKDTRLVKKAKAVLLKQAIILRARG